MVVQWLKAESAEVHDVSELALVDRAFMEGDVVVRANDPRGQSGSVVAVRLLTDVEYLKSKEIEKAVSGDRLTTVTTGGEWAVQGNWLGRISDTDIAVTVLFSDGAVCVVRSQRAVVCQVHGNAWTACCTKRVSCDGACGATYEKCWWRTGQRRRRTAAGASQRRHRHGHGVCVPWHAGSDGICCCCCCCCCWVVTWLVG